MKNVLLINEDASLMDALRPTEETLLVSTPDTTRLRQKFKKKSFPFIILETKKDWKKDLRRLISNGNSNDISYMVIASSSMLKQTADHLKDIIPTVVNKSPSLSPPPATKNPSAKKGPDLALEELIEHKFRYFVKQMNRSGGRNLHAILLKEIEAPLIRITLKETNGNQIQAASLLGMNRNTLRKKIKELKIPMPRTSRKKTRG